MIYKTKVRKSLSFKEVYLKKQVSIPCYDHRSKGINSLLLSSFRLILELLTNLLTNSLNHILEKLLYFFRVLHWSNDFGMKNMQDTTKDSPCE